MYYISLTNCLSRLGIDYSLSNQEAAGRANARHLANAVGSDSPLEAVANVEADLLRAVAAYDIDLVGCLALLIKLQWERHQGIDAMRAPGTSRTEAQWTPEYVDQSGFVPDYDTLYQLFSDVNGMLEDSNYSEQSFRLLCREMTSAKLFWGDINSAELEAFRRREERNLGIFSNAAAAEIQAFQRKKLFWLEVYDQLGEKLLVLERLRLRCEEINRQFMVEFGDVHLALEEQLLRLEEAGLRVEYCRANLGVGRNEVEKAIAGRIAERKEQLRQLQHDIFMAPYLEKERAGASMDQAEFLEYRARVKRLLLEIRMILHPDRLVQIPQYGELTLDQQSRLAELWHQVQRIDSVEAGHKDDQIGGILRSLALLDSALNEAKAILAQPGIDTDVQLIPQGDSLVAQMEWLGAAIDWIDELTDEVMAEVQALQQDETFSRRQALLACSPEKKAEVRNEMEALVQEYARETGELEAELESLLTEVEHDQAD